MWIKNEKKKQIVDKKNNIAVLLSLTHFPSLRDERIPSGSHAAHACCVIGTFSPPPLDQYERLIAEADAVGQIFFQQRLLCSHPQLGALGAVNISHRPPSQLKTSEQERHRAWLDLTFYLFARCRRNNNCQATSAKRSRNAGGKKNDLFPWNIWPAKTNDELNPRRKKKFKTLKCFND